MKASNTTTREKESTRGMSPTPHPNKLKRIVDKLIYVVAVFGLSMTIPQLLKIWIEKNASGVSAISWGAYLVLAIFWVIYGILHREKTIILIYSGWIALEVFIVTGIIMYG